jgi:4-hydroxybenzoyl-CoA thioesterase
MIYRRIIPIEFNHCDPAGIVFYPRYFEMTNSVVENFFDEVLGHSYAHMMEERRGVPTVRIEVDFRVPSRLGDKPEFRLELLGVGRSSVRFQVSAWAGQTERLCADLTLVYVNELGVADPWPDTIRNRMIAFKEGAANDNPA